MKRFQELGTGSFFGDMLYEQAVRKDHFLRKLDELVDWPELSKPFIRLYKGGAEEGRPPYEPVVLLKMLLLAYLYNISEREVERYVQDSISAKWFLGLAVDVPAPDHSTLTAFKRRIVESRKEQCLQSALETVVKQAQAKGIEIGSVQIVDSTHTQANVNPAKDDQRKKEGKPPRDADAQWGAKAQREARDERGGKGGRVQYYCGYKMHASLNAGSELITSVVVTGGNVADSTQFLHLVRRDREQGLPVTTYAADRGYDDGHSHYQLESEGLHSAIKLKGSRTHRKDGHEGVWLELMATPEYQAGQAERYKIERKFGEAKVNHGLRRCRYLGRLRYAIQAYMTVIALDLKRMVRLLTGVAFKGRARVGLAA